MFGGMIMPPSAARKQWQEMTDERQAAASFSEWLQDAMKRRGLDKQTALATASGVAQSTVSMYLSGERKPEKREQVEKLVRGLLPKDADESRTLKTLNSGLLAAGLAPLPSGAEDKPIHSFVAQAGYQDDHLTPEDEAELELRIEETIVGYMEKKKKPLGVAQE